MVTAPELLYEQPQPTYSSRAALEVVTGTPSSHTQLENYFEIRRQAQEAPKVGDQRLIEIQTDVAQWIEESGILKLPDSTEERAARYTQYSAERAQATLIGLTNFLARYHADEISLEELEATRAFVSATFATYNDEPKRGDVMPDADGSFAFVVPARMGRNHPEYGKEVEPAIPALRYVPNELRAQMMVGLPPFVIDTYKPDAHGRRGYLVFAPVFEDMQADLGRTLPALIAAQTNINAAVDFAHRRFGVEIVGLGATLPALTHYGQTIQNPNVITTTGHGGTTELIGMTVESALKGKTPESIGVLGLGSIGASIAQIIAERFPNTPINVADSKPGRAERFVEQASNDQLTPLDNKDLMNESQVIISAVTRPVDLSNIKTLEGKLIVDDSQPGSFDPETTKELGAMLLWVIGRDTTGTVAVREGFDYSTMLDPLDIFGCEAEAASLAKYMGELRDRGMPEDAVQRIIAKIALREAVTPKRVRLISALFKKYGITTAEHQAFGQAA